MAPVLDELFPLGKVPWARAVHHSPDIMQAAADAAAIDRGEFTLVLGEIHLAVNTLEARPFVEHSPEPDHRGRRVVLVSSNASLGVSSRTSPSAPLADDDTYISWHADDAVRAPDAVPAAALHVTRRRGELVVRSDRRAAAGRLAPGAC